MRDQASDGYSFWVFRAALKFDSSCLLFFNLAASEPDSYIDLEFFKYFYLANCCQNEFQGVQLSFFEFELAIFGYFT